MFEFRNSYKKYFFACIVSKLAQFTPFESINIPSKRELLIISATFLSLSCASMHKSSLVRVGEARQTGDSDSELDVGETDDELSEINDNEISEADMMSDESDETDE